MAVTGGESSVGMGGMDDTPIDWSCHSASYAEVGWFVVFNFASLVSQEGVKSNHSFIIGSIV